ncbi:Os12g0472300 [Oryza sativa Japonica Group]|uniref:Os12g0472300 protein n=1 Tax=Oryza sativa subsp. japonica TaxID=39947 RepID=A0A0P0YAB8_ORYSJ|nr:Os12g0472300 [Oryza sativa Japonica Group]
MASVETWVGFGSAMAGVGLLWSRMPEHVHEEARYIISSLVPMAMSYFNPYEQITVSEYGEERFRRNKMFGAVSTYLSRVCAGGACKLKAELCNNTKDDPVVTLDENQEVVDSFDGARMWWRLCPKASKNKGAITVSYYPGETDEPRCFRLVFHKRHRQLVLSSYLPSVVRRWRELTAKNRQRRLFTNHASEGNKSVWTSVPYNPPATFDMLAMDHAKKNNSELRKLFLDTTDKSIIVIEDIDAIEDELTTKRKGNKVVNGDDEIRDKHIYAGRVCRQER